jgi:predicted nucleic acid-binding protein
MSGTVVVDASVALKWLVMEAYSDVAEQLLRGWLSQGVRILAPALLPIEIANALYKRVRRGELTHDDARKDMTSFLGITLTFASEPALSMRALELAQRHTLKAVYDAHYLALAEREGCDLWTADERLWNSMKGAVDWVRWIGGWQPADTNGGETAEGPNGESPVRASDE